METPYLTPTGEVAPVSNNSDINSDVESSGRAEKPKPLLADVDNEMKEGSLAQVFYLALPSFAVFFAVTIYAPLVNRLKADYNATAVEYNLNITFALVGLALAPIVLIPLLQGLGSKRATLCSWLLFIVFDIGSAFVKNLGGLVVLRFFGFLFGGPVLSLFLTSLVQLTRTRSQHFVFSLASATCLLGISLGPLVGGLIEGHAIGKNQDWSRYLVPILCLVAILPYAVFGSQSLALVSSTPNSSPTNTSERFFQRIKSQYTSFIKPFIHFNTKELIVIGITLYVSQLYFFFLVTLAGFPYAFGQIRGYNPSEIALTYLSLIVGVILSTLLPLITIRQRSFSTSSNKQPEAALRDMLFAIILIPVGLFLFAWTGSMPKVHWAAPMVGIILFAFGSNVTITHLNVYLANV
jgi:MFS family permease